jgi:hypothetical protein
MAILSKYDKPTITKTASGGTITDFGGGGLVYSNPMDNPNFNPPKSVTPTPTTAMPTPVTPTKLPEQPKTTKKTTPASSSSFSMDNLIAASKPAIDRADIERQVESQFGGIRGQIQGRYGEKIQEAKAQGQQQTRALEGQMGTGRRFSSSAQAFIQFVRSENDKKVAALEVQMEDALSTANFKMAELVNQQIKDTQIEAQQNFENMFKIMEYADKKEKEQAAAQAPSIQASREAAIVSLWRQGVQDPADLFDYLNFDESGELVGDISVEEITTTIEKFKSDKEQINDMMTDLKKNGAPSDVISKVGNSNNINEAMNASGDWLQTGSGIVGEYLFYKREATAAGQIPMSFNEYQNVDANRKARATASANAGGLTSQENSTFVGITTKYQQDAVINAAIKATQINTLADQIIADPQSATNQVASLYLYVKNLDPDSAVKEGELALAGATQSYYGKFNNTLTRISEGRVLTPDAAKALAQATKDLVKTWEETAIKKERYYRSQAANSSPNVGNAFEKYLSDVQTLPPTNQEIINTEERAKGFVNSYITNNPDKADWVADLYETLNATDSEIYEYLKMNGDIQEGQTLPIISDEPEPESNIGSFWARGKVN